MGDFTFFLGALVVMTLLVVLRVGYWGYRWRWYQNMLKTQSPSAPTLLKVIPPVRLVVYILLIAILFFIAIGGILYFYT